MYVVFDESKIQKCQGRQFRSIKHEKNIRFIRVTWGLKGSQKNLVIRNSTKKKLFASPFVEDIRARG